MDITQLTHYERDLLKQFKAEVADQVHAIGSLDSVDVLVGVTHRYNRAHLLRIIEAARSGLMQMGLPGKAAVIHVGPEGAAEMVASVHEELDTKTPIPVHALTLPPHFDGRAWRIRALMEAAKRVHASLLVLSTSVVTPNGTDDADGFSARWITRLLTPVSAHGQDLAVARFTNHPLTHPIESHLVYPILAGVFGYQLPQVSAQAIAMSQRLVENYLEGNNGWPHGAGEFGAGPRIAVRAILDGMAVCEVPLGDAPTPYDPEDLKSAFQQTANTVFAEVAANEEAWQKRAAPIASPSLWGANGRDGRRLAAHPSSHLRGLMHHEFATFERTLYPAIVPDALRERVVDAEHGSTDLGLSDVEWVDLLRRFLLAYRFDKRFDRKDVVAGLFPFFLARVATFRDDARRLMESLAPAAGSPDTGAGAAGTAALDRDAREDIACGQVDRALRRQADRFVAAWPEFRKEWRDLESTSAPYLARLGAWEFVPNAGVIVPQEVKRADGSSAWAHEAYKATIDRYRTEYTHFATEKLGVVDPTDSDEVVGKLEAFMDRLEGALAGGAFPGDIGTVDGARKTLEHLCDTYGAGDVYHLTKEAAQRILLHLPPSELLVRRKSRNVKELLEEIDPRDAISMAAYTDQLPYLHSVLEFVEGQATTAWFESSPLWATTVDVADMPTVEPVGTAALARLGGRVIMSNRPEGSGGTYRHLWFLLRVMKSIVATELFSDVWRSFATAKTEFGPRVVVTIREHWGRRMLSAHNMFENQNHRVMLERIRRFADGLASRNEDAAERLRAACDVYHLSITLPDATFVPMSAWTWASYSARGGAGVPTPLSSLVERDWSTRDFLTAYLESAGMGDDEDVFNKVIELIRGGREPEDLRRHMLGVSADPDRLVVQQAARADAAEAARLVRPREDALLSPTSNAWESRYVLNAAVLRVDGTIYILYRAFGDDQVSRIGMAWTKDGIHIDGRLDTPVFAPETESESRGCEDPRTVIIDGRIYMLYTAWDGVLPQIAMASIPVDAFLERRFDQWERHGHAYPGLSNKDAVLYPEKINGRYAVYHRIDPNMWVSYLDTLACPWPRADQKIFAGPRPGMMWDGVKIGAGGPPIKTTKGWLNIYHGVDYERSYRLGAFLMPLDDPSKVLYRTPNPILEPTTHYELGDDSSWVPHVVFTCGAVPAVDKDVIGPDDEILVYYGAADTVIGVATGRLRDIIPVIDDL